MKHILNDFKKFLNDKSEIIINLLLVVSTVVLTMNLVDSYKTKKIENRQKNVIKKQIEQYDGQELTQPTQEVKTLEIEIKKNEEVDKEKNIENKIEEKSTENVVTEVPAENVVTEVSVEKYTNVTPETMNIMGYEEINIDKAITFIVGLVGEDNINKIKLNGTSLNFHISNTNKAAKAENVNAYFVLSQQLLETGNLKFENSCVKPEYYNFAGLGATDANPKPNKFFSNYEGQLAQVQHLKGYASTEKLNEECKDQRFELLNDKRGSATNAADLSNKWASNNSYGESLVEMYNQFHNTEVNPELVNKYKYMVL